MVGAALVGGALVGGEIVGGEAVDAGLAGVTVVTGSAEPPSDEQAIGPRRRPAAASAAALRTNQLPSLGGVSGRRAEGIVEVGSEVMFMVRV
jgi:hypothetical protein